MKSAIAGWLTEVARAHGCAEEIRISKAIRAGRYDAVNRALRRNRALWRENAP
jgi:hypothetical protein